MKITFKSNGSIEFLVTLLTLIFVGLKVTGFISWAWWLVFLPAIIYGVIAVGLIIGIVAFSIYLIARQ